MKRLFAIAVLCLAVAACSSIPNPFSAPTLAKVETAYAAALAVAQNYKDACVARVIAPSCRTIVVQMQAYDRNAYAAIVSARKLVGHPTISPVSALLAAQEAISVFRSFQVQKGVGT